MTLQHIPFDQFKAKSWKNGLGTTYDIALFPTDANHTSFELRFALSPIVEDNVFSAFPGVERVITPIEGGALRLEFDDTAAELALFTSLRFDSALTPMGKPTHGSIKVINVMARRNSWNIRSCEVTDQGEHETQHGELLFLFALDNCSVQSGDEEVSLAKHDAVLATGATHVSITAPTTTKLLHAHIQPV